MAIQRRENWLGYLSFPFKVLTLHVGGGGGGGLTHCQKIANNWVMVATDVFSKNRLLFPLIRTMVLVAVIFEWCWLL